MYIEWRFPAEMKELTKLRLTQAINRQEGEVLRVHVQMASDARRTHKVTQGVINEAWYQEVNDTIWIEFENGDKEHYSNIKKIEVCSTNAIKLSYNDGSYTVIEVVANMF